jgi:hypothetical protein
MAPSGCVEVASLDLVLAAAVLHSVASCNPETLECDRPTPLEVPAVPEPLDDEAPPSNSLLPWRSLEPKHPLQPKFCAGPVPRGGFSAQRRGTGIALPLRKAPG